MDRLGRSLRRSPRFFRLLVALRLIHVLDRPALRRYAKRHGRIWPLPAPLTDVDEEPLRGPIRPALPAGEGLNVSEPYPWSLDPGFVCELRDVSLLGHKPVVATADGRYVLDSLAPTRSNHVKLEDTFRRLTARHGLAALRSGFTGAHRVPSGARHIPHACLLTDGLQHSYYHWVLEQLTKLRAVDEYRRHTGETPTLVLPYARTRWMLELIDLVGYGDAETFHWSGPRNGRVDRLVLPSYPVPTPASCGWLRERVLGDAEAAPEERRERILIARGDGYDWWRRAVVNQDELEAALEPLGFRSYRLAEMSVLEQARLFDRAEAIVGVHGAGFTNMVFSRGAAVLELFGRQVRPHYFRLAHVVGLPYRYLLCEPVSAEEVALHAPSPDADPVRGVDPGLRVDVAALTRALAEMGIGA